MLKPREVYRVILVGSRDNLRKTIDVLHSARAIHLSDFKGEEGFQLGKPFEEATPLSEKLLLLRSSINILGISPEEGEPVSVNEIEERMESFLGRLENEIKRSGDERKRMQEMVKESGEKISELEPISGLPLFLEDYSGYDSLSVFVGRIKMRVKERPDFPSEIYYDEERKIIALFVKKEDRERAQKFLLKHGWEEVKVPSGKGNPSILLNEARKQKESSLQRISRIDGELREKRKELASFILAAEEHLSIKVQKAEAPLRFATTANSFFLEGWILKDKYEEVKQRLEDVYLEILDYGEEDVPVELHNPKVVRPFELLINLFSRPLYKEIDPTTILFFTFSLFFGFMLGDVGYGTILVLLGFLLKKKPVFGIGGKEVGNVIVIAGISSIIFGIIIFAEAFGLHFAPHSPHHHSLYWTDLLGIHGVYFSYTFLGVEFPLSKLDVEDIALLLILTPILGVVHMSFGLLLGFRNEAIMHGLKKAVTVKIGWLLLFLCMLSLLLLIPKLGLSPIIGSLLSLMEGKFPSFSFPGILFYILLAMALSAIILLFMGEGMSALFELPSVLANSLSYTRLAAVAIAKAGMAFSANMMIFELGGPAFLITGFFIHAMVPLLGLIACGLQSIRLQYYEFFHKFYEGGGPEFIPFGRERRLSYE